jgi:hypothetical protein
MGVPKEKNHVKETCVMVVQDAKTGQVLKVTELGPNLITDAGDLYYAKRGAGSADTYTFSAGQMVVAKSFTVAPAKTSTFGYFVLQETAGSPTYWGRQDFASGYPTTNDADTNNSGRTADAITYKTVYTTGQANGTIKAIGICRDGGATNSSGQLLSFKTLASADILVKTSSVTLTVYINHTFAGA